MAPRRWENSVSMRSEEGGLRFPLLFVDDRPNGATDVRLNGAT
jgi:hypothetical protein